jgi:hypothetical protein
MDYMGPFVSSNGNTHILVAAKYVTKWLEALPTPLPDAASSTRMIKDTTFPRFGVPCFLMMADLTFRKELLRKILHNYGVTHRFY